LPTAQSRAWEDDLNEQQLAAVQAGDGPVLVLAGAGSGKTRVITYRVAWLISERRVQPSRILLTTFTNKAARGMIGRVEELCGPLAREITGGTFHHTANLILRGYAPLLGYDSAFTILDESDAQQVMRLCRGEAGVEKGDKAFPSPRLLRDIASGMVNTNRDLDGVLALRYPHLMEQYGEIQKVLVDYTLRKQTSNQMDFDDLLLNLHRLLQGGTEALNEAREALCSRYQHVLVDEYQDVNHLQAEIVGLLYRGAPAACGGPGASPVNYIGDALATGEGARATAGRATGTRGLFVVGDDAQSIYSFRGADYENIRSFPRRYSGARVCKLEINYRSTPEVLALANAVLSEGDPVFRKTLTPVRRSLGDRPVLLGCHDGDEQAQFVATQCMELRESSGLDWREMAVLYRAHSNRLEVELEFVRRAIPFVVRGGLRFFEQAHIKDFLSYAAVLANERDELAWQRMLGMCRRVGPKTILEVMHKLRGGPDGMLARFTSNGIADTARGQGRQSLGELRDFLRGLSEKHGEGAPESRRLPVADILQLILDERYRAYLEVQYENWRQRLEDIDQLISYSQRFETLQSLLAELGLDSLYGRGDLSARGADEEEGAVTLSTIHQAKGLEWKVVFVVSAHDGVIPHSMALADPLGEDEERRLLYVALTRAQEQLYLSYPIESQLRDSTGYGLRRVINRPSRFLVGLPQGVYDEAKLEWG
jgi:DNA helicase II / ATP-dependent DNA helicase PcrA